ncbi:phosphotransferase family protein [Primorskyibacter sp. 2E107]|uniref:phosphotransferase family protein n=1 Tax=Primorskyibacter sp. 2E107 TaxID=3403458 RepID=UPI003AF9B394
MNQAEIAARSALRTLWPGWTGSLSPLGQGAGRTVLRATGGPRPLVVKLWPEEQRDKAIAQAARQAAVSEQLCDGLFRAPQVLQFDAAQRVMVMADCGGQDLGTLLAQAQPAEAERLMARAGAWIAALHAPSRRDAPFRPIGHLNWLDKLVSQGETGARAIHDLDAFRQHVQALHGLFQEVRRRPSVRAITHKDLSAGNLLVTNTGTLWGIDFENSAEDEALRDLFTLGLDALSFAPFGHDRRRALAALGRGYGPAPGDPLVRLFLQRAFALGYWARTPLPHSRRQAARMAAACWILSQDDAVV